MSGDRTGIDHARSRAILISVSNYQHRVYPPVPAAANSSRRMHAVLTNPYLCGWPDDRVTLINDPVDSSKLIRELRRLARETTDVLLFYFVGHGTITERGELVLVLRDTDDRDVDITGVQYGYVREMFRDSPARVKLSILDCCYSGRAIQALGASQRVADIAQVRGTYTLTAADQAAHVPPLVEQVKACTSFTGEFLDLVADGIVGGPAELTLDNLYLQLRHRLTSRVLPIPNKRADDTVGHYTFTRNAAYVGPVPSAAAASPKTPSTSTRAEATQLPIPTGSTRSELTVLAGGTKPRLVIDRGNVKDLKSAVSIETVVSDYVGLRKVGSRLRGLCPFHEGEESAFTVNPDKGVYFCFDCSQGGDIIDFVRKVEHLSFDEAKEWLASRAGITLRDRKLYRDHQGERVWVEGERARLVEIQRFAADWFAEQLATPEAEVARSFLKDRGFGADAAVQFQLGYAPRGFENLTSYLQGHGFTDKELLLSGVCAEGRRGLMDRFRGRLVWPICGITGEVVGFGARRLHEDDNGPKYLNTPTTPLYDKSQVLYGLERAKKDIAKTGGAVVVDGYTDVMACHLAGIATAVATCGTVLGTNHTKVLRRLLMDGSPYRGGVVLTFDDDAAGQNAALRAFEGDQKWAARISIAISPGGMGLRELRLAQGDAAVRDLVDHAVPLFEFVIKMTVARHNVDSAEGQAAALQEAAPIVARIRDRSIQHEYALQLAKMIRMPDERFVVRQVLQITRSEQERSAHADSDCL